MMDDAKLGRARARVGYIIGQTEPYIEETRLMCDMAAALVALATRWPETWWRDETDEGYCCFFCSHEWVGGNWRDIVHAPDCPAMRAEAAIVAAAGEAVE